MFPKRVGNGQFGPAGAVNFIEARSPTRRVAASGVIQIGPRWGPVCGNVWC